MIFRQIGFVSFATSLTEGVILEKPSEETEVALKEAAAMIAMRYQNANTLD